MHSLRVSLAMRDSTSARRAPAARGRAKRGADSDSSSFQSHQIGREVVYVGVRVFHQHIFVELKWIMELHFRDIAFAYEGMIVAARIRERDVEVIDMIQRATKCLARGQCNGRGDGRFWLCGFTPAAPASSSGHQKLAL